MNKQKNEIQSIYNAFNATNREKLIIRKTFEDADIFFHGPEYADLENRLKMIRTTNTELVLRCAELVKENKALKERELGQLGTMETDIKNIDGTDYRFVRIQEEDANGSCSICVFHNKTICSTINCNGGFFIEEVKEKKHMYTEQEILRIIEVVHEFSKEPWNIAIEKIQNKLNGIQ